MSIAKECEFKNCAILAGKGYKTQRYLCRKHARIFTNYGRLYYISPKNGTSKYRGTPEYTAWVLMKYRCKNSNHPQWRDYGGRGIKVHPDWEYDFLAFLKYVGKKPTPNHTIDRIDNDGNYEPGNIRWATRTEQTSNRRYSTWEGRKNLLKRRYSSLESGLSWNDNQKRWRVDVMSETGQINIYYGASREEAVRQLKAYAASL